MTKLQKQRVLALEVASRARSQGVSKDDFELAVYDGSLPSEDIKEAFFGLLDRGELHHLLTFVWTWKR